MLFNQAANEKIEELCYENYFTLIHNGSISRNDLVGDASIKIFYTNGFWDTHMNHP